MRAEALSALAGVDDPRVLDRLAAAAGDDDISVRHAAVEALSGRKDARAVHVLVSTALRDGSDLVRQSAFRAFHDVACPDCLDLIVAAMRDPDENVRLNAVQLMEGSDGPAAAKCLSAAALTDDSTSVRRRATLALELVDSPGVLTHLTAALKDDNPTIRTNAVEALGIIGNPQAAKILATVLADSDPRLREKAVRESERWEKPMRSRSWPNALADDDPAVRQSAAEALNTITGQNFGEDRDSWMQWWEEKQKQ